MKKFFLLAILFLLTINLADARYFKNNTASSYNTDYIFELLEECLGRQLFKEIVNTNSYGCTFSLDYKLDGSLDRIMTGKALFFNYSFFTEGEWEKIFDFFNDLPPIPLPAPYKYGERIGTKLYVDYDSIVKRTYNIILNYGVFCQAGECPKQSGVVPPQLQWPKHISHFDWVEMHLYSDSSEISDPLFGVLSWKKLKPLYYEKINSKDYKPMCKLFDTIEFDTINASDFKREGYCWEKIPIKNYNVDIQVPIGSKIEIANDTLATNVTFPDSTFMSIQYTKGMPGAKLTNDETNPRRRKIEETTVTDKFVSSAGNFDHEGKTVYWRRMRYRYGITVTLYTSSKKKLDEYYKPVFSTLTTVLRPKYKTIYLKD